MEEVWKCYEAVFQAMRATILGSKLTDEEKGECLAQMRHDPEPVTISAEP